MASARQRIDRSREGRLWITQVVVPIFTTAVAFVFAVAGLKEKVGDVCNGLKGKIFKKN